MKTTEWVASIEGYQARALSTAGSTRIEVLALGLCGEAGEVADIIKKHLGHGHPIDTEKVALEMGDVLWYLAVLAHEIGYSLTEVANMNIDKLARRYPDGFSAERSQSRGDT